MDEGPAPAPRVAEAAISRDVKDRWPSMPQARPRARCIGAWQQQLLARPQLTCQPVLLARMPLTSGGATVPLVQRPPALAREDLVEAVDAPAELVHHRVCALDLQIARSHA